MRLAKEGVGLLLCDKDGDGINSLTKRLKKAYPKVSVETEVFDVSNRVAVTHFCSTLSERKELWGLVNNVGIYFGRDLFDYSLEEMETVLSVNLFFAIQMSQCFGNLLVKSQTKGVIVNMSSISAFEGSSDALYGVSKAGLIGLTRACGLTFAPWVRVNAVAPGLVDTPMIDAIPKWRLAEFEKGERLKERITPEAVAASVWFLLSDESKHTTGSVIDINNGGYFR